MSGAGGRSTLQRIDSASAGAEAPVAKIYGCRIRHRLVDRRLLQLDTEDYSAGDGILSVVGATGSMCGKRLKIKPQTS